MTEMQVNTDNLDAETEQRVRDLGHISITPEAKEILDAEKMELTDLFEKYAKGDYGSDVPFEKRWENDVAFYQRKGKVIGIYTMESGRKISITTAWCMPVTEIKEME